MDQYVILAQILLKMDKNLKKTRRDLVPELVTEDEFWRNYFYQVELFRSELGLQNSLGQEFTHDQIVSKLKEVGVQQEEKLQTTQASSPDKSGSAEKQEGKEIEMQSITEEKSGEEKPKTDLVDEDELEI